MMVIQIICFVSIGRTWPAGGADKNMEQLMPEEEATSCIVCIVVRRPSISSTITKLRRCLGRAKMITWH